MAESRAETVGRVMPNSPAETQSRREAAPWPKVRLGEIGRIAMCKRILKGETTPQGDIPFFKIGTFGKEADAFISKSKFEHFSKLYSYPKKGSVLISAAGTIGRLVVFNGLPAYFQDSNIVWLEHDGQRLCDKYLYYTLLGHKWQFTQGATIQRLYNDDIRNTAISLPPLPVQRAIAKRLSAYDNLIENNRRRIAILERKAEQLYKEWFVRKRFPGHTAATSVALPTGWSVVRLGDILEVKYGKDHKILPDGNIPIFGSGGIMRYGNRALYDGEAVLIPRKGSLNNIMFFIGAFWTVDTMFYGLPKLPFIAKYLYMTLLKIDMASFNTGAALPSMTTDILNHFKITLPASDILEAFDKQATKLLALKDNLQRQNALLSRQRDLLLPRLMSGKLEVMP